MPTQKKQNHQASRKRKMEMLTPDTLLWLEVYGPENLI